MATLQSAKDLLKRQNRKFLIEFVNENSNFSFEEVIFAALSIGDAQKVSQIKTDIQNGFNDFNTNNAAIDGAGTFPALKTVWANIILNRADRKDFLRTLGPDNIINA